MNRGSAARGSQFAAKLVFVCIAVHLACDFLLVSRAWFLDGIRLLWAIALPLSQCSLATIWAITDRGNLAIRFAVPPLITVACWYILSQLLGWGIGEPASAAWAITLAVQTTSLIIAVHLYRTVVALIARRKNSNESAASPFRFNLATLFLWSTAIACGFGFIQFGRDRWRWDKAVTDWEFLNAMPIIGIFNAILAASWLWCCATGRLRWRTAKCLMTALAIGLATYGMPYFIDWTTGSRALEIPQVLALSAGQSFVLLVTLWIVCVAKSHSDS